MSPFASDIDAWHDFFVMTGTVAATLIGLLFVAVSLRRDIREQAHDSYIRAIVSQNMRSYLTVLLFSLYFVIPELTPTGIATPLIITSVAALVPIVHDGLRLRTAGERSGKRAFRWEFLVPALSYLAAIVVGVALMQGRPGRCPGSSRSWPSSSHLPRSMPGICSWIATKEVRYRIGTQKAPGENSRRGRCFQGGLSIL